MTQEYKLAWLIDYFRSLKRQRKGKKELLKMYDLLQQGKSCIMVCSSDSIEVYEIEKPEP